jgi:hypothetical protein
MYFFLGRKKIKICKVSDRCLERPMKGHACEQLRLLPGPRAVVQVADNEDEGHKREERQGASKMNSKKDKKDKKAEKKESKSEKKGAEQHLDLAKLKDKKDKKAEKKDSKKTPRDGKTPRDSKSPREKVRSSHHHYAGATRPK